MTLFFLHTHTHTSGVQTLVTSHPWHKRPQGTISGSSTSSHSVGTRPHSVFWPPESHHLLSFLSSPDPFSNGDHHLALGKDR